MTNGDRCAEPWVGAQLRGVWGRARGRGRACLRGAGGARGPAGRVSSPLTHGGLCRGWRAQSCPTGDRRAHSSPDTCRLLVLAVGTDGP